MQSEAFYPKPHFLACNQPRWCHHSFQFISGHTHHLLGPRWCSLSLASKEYAQILKQTWLSASYPVLTLCIATVKITVTFDLIWKSSLIHTQDLATSSTVNPLETREPDRHKYSTLITIYREQAIHKTVERIKAATIFRVTKYGTLTVLDGCVCFCGTVRIVQKLNRQLANTHTDL